MTSDETESRVLQVCFEWERLKIRGVILKKEKKNTKNTT